MTALEMSPGTGQDRRRDPSLDRRRVVLYAVGLVVFYVGAIVDMLLNPLSFPPAVGR